MSAVRSMSVYRGMAGYCSPADGGSACRLLSPERSCYARSRDKRRRQRPYRPCGSPAKRQSIRLPAASLLEAVVASVVLLIVFAASLETVVRLTAGPSGRNRLRRSRLPGRLHGERNPTGSFLRGQDRTLLRMGNADGSHRALRFLSGAMAGDADGENRGRTQKNGIPVFGRSGTVSTETRSSAMNDCKTVRKRLTEGRAGCPSQLWAAARSAERART